MYPWRRTLGQGPASALDTPRVSVYPRLMPIPRRYYRGQPKRLTFPKNRIHSCTCCGTHYVDAPCPSDKKSVKHKDPEFCTPRCERMLTAWGLA